MDDPNNKNYFAFYSTTMFNRNGGFLYKAIHGEKVIATYIQFSPTPNINLLDSHCVGQVRRSGFILRIRSRPLE